MVLVVVASVVVVVDVVVEVVVEVVVVDGEVVVEEATRTCAEAQPPAGC